MTIANAVQVSSCALPLPLQAAQKAIQSPEVQAMLRRLAEYNLGIFMPHGHDELTGELSVLPDDVMQMESGLKVSFVSMDKVSIQPKLFLPVGWLWRGGAATPVAACEMDEQESPGDKKRSIKHKM